MIKYIFTIILLVIMGCNIGHPTKTRDAIVEKNQIGQFEYRSDFSVKANMKPILSILLSFIISCNNQSKDLTDKKNPNSQEVSIKFLFPECFGKEFLFDAIIVDKPNTYFAQNILKEKYFLKIISVNSIKLKQPIVVEPSNLSSENYELNQIVTLKGHEELYSAGQIHYLDSDYPIQLNFHYRNVIVISQYNKSQKQMH